MTLVPFVVILGYVAAAMGGAWLFFRRYAIQRPPIGIFNLWDVGLMLVGIVLIPYLYLAFPDWLVGTLLGIGAFGILDFLLEPILRRQWLALGGALGLCAATVALAQVETMRAAFYALNNTIQLCIAIGVTNLWAQSGMRARDAALLGVALSLYDTVFTALLPLMTDLFVRLIGLPFAPLIVWPAANGQWLALGLGDVLLATLFPLVMRKAFGRAAGLLAFGLGLTTIALVLALPLLGLLHRTFPVMVVLGPVMGAQYLLWRWRYGSERSTQAYLRAEPLR